MCVNIGIVEFPGTNCERETAAAVLRAGMNPVHLRWNCSLAELRGLDGYILPGGFSYEDRSRSGIIAALDPLIPHLKEEAERGKPVVGICNGAQILVETGMVPGLPGYLAGAALAGNRRIRSGKIQGTGFYNSWVTVRAEAGPPGCAFTACMPPGTLMRIPVAHAEGRFVIPPQLLEQMSAANQTLLRYTDSSGYADPQFPVNPNGSTANLAGICSPRGNVLALMPHPERTPAGDPLFLSMRSFLENSGSGVPDPAYGLRLDPLPLGPSERRYQCPKGARELLIQLIITDNTAVSVENALRQRGLPLRIERRTHWELSFSRDAAETLEAAVASGELYNTNKEFLCSPPAAEGAVSILIRDPDDADTVGDRTRHALNEWFSLSSVTAVRSGTLWTMIPDTDDPKEAAEICSAAEATHIFANPLATERYLYGK
jgi:phosphoribosylformylglycinamidine synthase subunit PurQ / glutaminase